MFSIGQTNKFNPKLGLGLQQAGQNWQRTAFYIQCKIHVKLKNS